MNRNDLRRVDLNMLIVFETLMHERSVTRAAEKLFLGQPAISAALGRLRNLFNDPLFVRSGRSMEPTARAREIFALLTPALDSISSAVSRATDFNPATSQEYFAWACPTMLSSPYYRPCYADYARKHPALPWWYVAPTIC